jgi:LAGLIDADG-like domain/TraM recognition site of TraD and TraG
MAEKYRNVGPEGRDQVNPQRNWHDMRRPGQKIADALRTPAGSMMPMFFMGVFSVMFSAMSDFFLFSGLLLSLFIRNAQKAYTLPAKFPRHSNLIDPAEVNPAGKAGPARGTFYMGNDRTTGEEVWLTNRDAGVHMLVLGTTGSGKAQPLDAKIHTPTGWRLMGDIKVGDLVTVPSGGSANVTGVFPQGELEIFKVTFADGRSTEACGDHLWEIHHKHWNGKYKEGVSRVGAARPRVLKTREIAELMERNKGTFSVRLSEAVELPKADLPLNPYLLGLLIGDGNFSGNRLRFSTADEELVDAVCETLPQTLELTQYASDGKVDYEIRYKPGFREKGGRNADGSYVTNPVRLALRALNLDGKTSFDKFIPEVYKNSSIEQRLLLLRGLMDSDGYAGASGGVSFSSSSQQLAKDVQDLVRSLGGIAKISNKFPTYVYNGEKKQGALSYTVSIRHPEPDSFFALERKKERCESYQYADSLKLGIVSIEAVGKKQAQCIMVDHVDHLYITDDYVVTHNTEMLLGICQNALNQGSGFMFVDGKAQDKIAFKIMDLVRARGRDDDFMALNFMTGAKDIIGPQAHKITNTMNPFAYGSSGMISQIVVGLMSGGGGGNDMWADRAISFVEGLSPPLVYMRDNYGMILDVNEYRKFFELDKIEELAWNGGTKYPGLDQVLDPLKNYLINLPGYDRNKFGRRGGQGDDTKLQHGYITMQLSRAFTSLADTYGHIVRVPLGEVFFPDLVKNRRILVVMLPSLEKTPSETANIGKIIVTALRNIMSEGLGARIEGDRDELDNDAGKALLPPYVVILDEYGYYAVKGFAVAFAQARSLGFVCIIGGQDLASFQKESKEEAVSICGNTRLKAFGSIEDPEQTMDFAVKTAGRATVAKGSGYDAEHGTFGSSYSDTMNVSFDQIDRINPTDVKSQKEGQFHFVIGPYVIRAATYYVDPKKVKKVRLNHFIQVRPPDPLQLDEIEMASSGLAERIANMDASTIDAPEIREITAAAQALVSYKDLASIERAIATIVHVGQTREAHIEKFRAAVRGQSRGDDAPDSYKRLADLDLSGFGEEPQSGSKSASSRELEEDYLPDPTDILAQAQRERAQESAGEEIPMSMNSAGGPNFEDVGAPTSMNVFVPTRKTSGFGADVFADSDRAKRIEDALAEPEDMAAPLLDYNGTFKGVQKLEIAMGASTEQAQAHAKEVVQEIEDATRYPLSVPKEKTGEQVNDMLQDLLSALED